MDRIAGMAGDVCSLCQSMRKNVLKRIFAEMKDGAAIKREFERLESRYTWSVIAETMVDGRRMRDD